MAAVEIPAPPEHVPCGGCGHPVERHDADGCWVASPVCLCEEHWTVVEIARCRVSNGLPADW